MASANAKLILPPDLKGNVRWAMETSRGQNMHLQFVAKIKDFLGEKFCQAAVNHPEAKAVISKLFEDCTKDAR